jgi:hypothetical protein
MYSKETMRKSFSYEKNFGVCVNYWSTIIYMCAMSSHFVKQY